MADIPGAATGVGPIDARGGAGCPVGRIPVTWRWLRYLATWVHEAGHATVALLSGRRVTSMKVAADSSGETVYWGSSGLVPS